MSRTLRANRADSPVAPRNRSISCSRRVLSGSVLRTNPKTQGVLKVPNDEARDQRVFWHCSCEEAPIYRASSHTALTTPCTWKMEAVLLNYLRRTS
jgi:hypothetical protein